ncbi:MAG: hypothetical protein ACLS8H_09075, partial [Ruminococcus sp.]
MFFDAIGFEWFLNCKIVPEFVTMIFSSSVGAISLLKIFLLQMIFPFSINTFIVAPDFYFSDIESNHVHIR